MIIMDVEKYKEMTVPCFRDEDPPCTSACPLGMDIRKFISKMKDGKYKAAYRVFRPKAVFPGIVSELCPETCMGSCTRAKKGKDAVRMKELEAFCFEKGVQKPERYRLAKKEEKAAVIGGGLSGLSCAYRLSSRGYRVTVFEKGENVGGMSLTLMDPEKALADIRREFSELDVCTFETGRDIRPDDLSGLSEEFNALYIATGKNGADFGLVLKDYIKTDRPGIFMGGLITGEKNQIEAMADGFNAAEYIELYFKLGPDAEPDFELLGSKKPDERFYDLDYEEPDTSGAEPESPEALASKCYECNCDNCYKVCSLMQEVRKYPKKIASDTIGTLRPNKFKRPGVRMIMGCTFCGKCKEVCPTDVDMGLLFKRARQDYYEDRTVPESFHEFWLQDMEFSLSGEASALYTPDPAKASEYVFFPGCRLSGMSPDIVTASYSYIRNSSSNASVYLGCCGVPGEWAGAADKRKAASDRIKEIWKKLDHPVFILACTACRKNLAGYCPEIKTVTLYQYMREHADTLPVPEVRQDDNEFTIFDPCGASGDNETISSVRELVELAGLKAKDTGSLPGCCGFGGHIYPANPALQDTVTSESSCPNNGTLITYCANCKDTFLKKGHKSVHLLDLFFGDGKGSSSPTLGAQRDNRRILKQKILSEEIMPYQYSNSLTFTDEAIDKMQRQLITEEDVDEVLKEKPLFSDSDSGTLYSKKRLGNITLWVAFKDENGSYLVTDIYKYRMEVQE